MGRYRIYILISLPGFPKFAFIDVSQQHSLYITPKFNENGSALFHSPFALTGPRQRGGAQCLQRHWRLCRAGVDILLPLSASCRSRCRSHHFPCSLSLSFKWQHSGDLTQAVGTRTSLTYLLNPPDPWEISLNVFLALTQVVVSSLVLLALVSSHSLLPLLPPSCSPLPLLPSSCSSFFSHLCGTVSFAWQLLLRSHKACGLAWSPPQQPGGVY